MSRFSALNQPLLEQTHHDANASVWGADLMALIGQTHAVLAQKLVVLGLWRRSVHETAEHMGLEGVAALYSSLAAGHENGHRCLDTLQLIVVSMRRPVSTCLLIEKYSEGAQERYGDNAPAALAAWQELAQLCAPDPVPALVLEQTKLPVRAPAKGKRKAVATVGSPAQAAKDRHAKRPRRSKN